MKLIQPLTSLALCALVLSLPFCHTDASASTTTINGLSFDWPGTSINEQESSDVNWTSEVVRIDSQSSTALHFPDFVGDNRRMSIALQVDGKGILSFDAKYYRFNHLTNYHENFYSTTVNAVELEMVSSPIPGLANWRHFEVRVDEAGSQNVLITEHRLNYTSEVIIPGLYLSNVSFIPDSEAAPAAIGINTSDDDPLSPAEFSSSPNSIIDTDLLEVTETFTATVIAPEGTTLQWYKDGEAIPGETGDTLTFEPPYSPADNGIYTLLASNGEASVQSPKQEVFIIPILEATEFDQSSAIVRTDSSNPSKDFKAISQSEITHDGSDALMLEAVSPSQQGYLSTYFTLPDNSIATFWLKTELLNDDFLGITVDGIQGILDSQDWAEVIIPEGFNHIGLQLYFNESTTNANSKIWIDDFKTHYQQSYADYISALYESSDDAIIGQEVDADNDGYTNAEEYSLGTLANDPQSVPVLDIEEISESDQLHITLKTNEVLFRNYYLESSDDLHSWTPVEEVEMAVIDSTHVEGIFDNPGAKFYRIRANYTVETE